jgi:hypothetical protein
MNLPADFQIADPHLLQRMTGHKLPDNLMKDSLKYKTKEEQEIDDMIEQLNDTREKHKIN